MKSCHTTMVVTRCVALTLAFCASLEQRERQREEETEREREGRPEEKTAKRDQKKEHGSQARAMCDAAGNVTPLAYTLSPVIRAFVRSKSCAFIITHHNLCSCFTVLKST